MIEKLRYWCHRILPLVYDDSLSYYEVLTKMTSKLNEVINWINDGFKEFIETQLAQIFVDTTYDPTTETLDFSIDSEGEAVGEGEIANLSVNQVSRPVKDTTARNNITALAQNIEGDLAELTETLNTVAGVGQSNILIVAKRGARFSTINGAIDFAKTYCNLLNRVTIVIVGGPRVVYEESIDLDDNPGIDFFGISQPLIRSTVAWRYSTIRCSNSIRVENIDFENYYTPETGEHAGYGLHADPITGTQIFKNCKFYSNNNAGAGLGGGASGEVDFYNCTFIGTNGVYLHNNSNDGTLGQWMRFHECSFRSFPGNPAVRIYDAATAINTSYVSQLGLKFVNCYAYPYDTVRYIYNGNQTINFVPSHNRRSNYSNGNIFITDDSICPSIIGLDFYLNNPHYRVMFTALGVDRFETIPYAGKYNWTISGVQYTDNSGVSWNDLPAAYTTQILTPEDRPNQMILRLSNQAAVPAGRGIRYDLIAVPK